MKWITVRKGNKYKRKLELSETDWMCLVMLIGIACVIIMSLVIEGM